MENNPLRKLIWDSEFFSKNIATVIDIDLATNEQLAKYELVCNKIDARDYNAIDKFCTLGFKIVEGELLFEKKIQLSHCESTTLEDCIATEIDIPQLVSLAELSYTSSRFRSPWFGNKQKEQFYGTWIEKAVLGSFDDTCLILKDDSKIKGFISLKKNDLQLSIGLIAVSKTYQGKGIAKQLLAMAEQYAIQQRCSKILVATQNSNLAAINLYIRNNYAINHSSYWLYRSNSTTSIGNK